MQNDRHSKFVRRSKDLLLYTTLFILGAYFLFDGLSLAKAFLAPLAIAILLCMLLLPVSQWLEKKGWQRGWAVLACVLLLLGFIATAVFAVSEQVDNLVDDWPEIREKVEPKLRNAETMIEDKTGKRYLKDTTLVYEDSEFKDMEREFEDEFSRDEEEEYEEEGSSEGGEGGESAGASSEGAEESECCRVVHQR